MQSCQVITRIRGGIKGFTLDRGEPSFYIWCEFIVAELLNLLTFLLHLASTDEDALLRAAGFLSHSDFRVRQRATSALALAGMCLDRQALQHGDSLDMMVNLKLMFDEPVVNPKESIRVDGEKFLEGFSLTNTSSSSTIGYEAFFAWTTILCFLEPQGPSIKLPA